jgi:hypothetical protein
MLDLIYCAGRNIRLSRIACETGWLLGMRSDSSPTNLPQTFIDIDYKKPDFEKHLEVVACYRPKYATIPDLSEENTSVADVERALKQAERLQKFCQIVLIVPKLAEQLPLIPPEYAIGYSIPSNYGGARFAIWEVEEHLKGRWIHLLGGSPRKQIEAYLQISSIAHVGSADGNYAQSQAVKYAMYWKRNSWHYHELKGKGKKDLYLECWQRSCQNIMKHWQNLDSEGM